MSFHCFLGIFPCNLHFTVALIFYLKIIALLITLIYFQSVHTVEPRFKGPLLPVSSREMCQLASTAVDQSLYKMNRKVIKILVLIIKVLYCTSVNWQKVSTCECTLKRGLTVPWSTLWRNDRQIWNQIGNTLTRTLRNGSGMYTPKTHILLYRGTSLARKKCSLFSCSAWLNTILSWSNINDRARLLPDEIFGY